MKSNLTVRRNEIPHSPQANFIHHQVDFTFSEDFTHPQGWISLGDVFGTSPRPGVVSCHNAICSLALKPAGRSSAMVMAV